MRTILSVVVVFAVLVPADAFAQREPDLKELQLEEHVFIYKSPDAKSVSLVGDFNSWDTTANPMSKRGTDNNWSTVVRLRKGKIYEYGFWVDGEIVLDPTNPIKTSDGKFSIFYIPDSPERELISGGIDFSDPKAIPAMFRRLEERLSYLTQTVSAMAQQIVKQNDIIMRKDVLIEKLNADCENLRLERLTLSMNLVQEQAKTAELRDRLAELKAETAPLAEKLREAEKTAEDCKRLLREREKKLNDALQEKLAMEAKLKTAEEKLATLEKTILDLQSRQAATLKQPQNIETTPSADATNPITQPPATGTTGTPPSVAGSVQGTIIHISPRSNLLAIDVGRPQNVAQGDEFIVIRGGKIIAKLVVESIEGDFSLAKVLPPYKKEDVKQGDIVRSVK